MKQVVPLLLTEPSDDSLLSCCCHGLISACSEKSWVTVRGAGQSGQGGSQTSGFSVMCRSFRVHFQSLGVAQLDSDKHRSLGDSAQPWCYLP